ncbi:hypothetical protein NC652_015559 [Populus alba x Populus x berolinensis]|uniref:Uncharacterized protein n=1 Tax=Populus alba x Populus x berolinensis TaxID=444605 RepID=A0AAD6QKF2_9ROSI|nr:hypothetical protein NC652_015559 [Populus alba x Populus x berolinensis]KAJ6991955.1 hypothetical protein NC653_015335 [Populus alba x Populus x berolinensis]
MDSTGNTTSSFTSTGKPNHSPVGKEMHNDGISFKAHNSTQQHTLLLFVIIEKEANAEIDDKKVV